MMSFMLFCVFEHTFFGKHIYTGWWLSPTPLKNMKVSWDDYSQNMEK